MVAVTALPALPRKLTAKHQRPGFFPLDKVPAWEARIVSVRDMLHAAAATKTTTTTGGCRGYNFTTPWSLPWLRHPVVREPNSRPVSPFPPPPVAPVIGDDPATTVRGGLRHF
jgi:hypothetical protein